MKKALLIVDPQNDFINGSLPVENATEKMNDLAKFINGNKTNYKLVIITVDWHPFSHASFVDNGGKWPLHCVQHTQGALIYQPLMDTLIKCGIPFIVLTKGTNRNKEEYSFIENYVSKNKFNRVIKKHNITNIDICGIASDYCVFETVKDLHENIDKNLSILVNFTPHIEDDNKLKDYANKKNIDIIT